jgi:hypothetical protein
MPPKKYQKTYRKWLSQFDEILMREEYGADVVEELIGKRPECACDPTLLLTREEWDEVLTEPKRKDCNCAHPKVYDLLADADIKDSLWQGSISDILKQTKLLIADYSSVCYNAFYQGAGVNFYQPDLEFYENENGRLIPESEE